MQGVLKTEPRRSLQTKRNSDGFAIHDASERLLSYYLSFGSQNISLTETYIIGQSEHLIKGFNTKTSERSWNLRLAAPNAVLRQWWAGYRHLISSDDTDSSIIPV
jgi:hypothetical protein